MQELWKYSFSCNYWSESKITFNVTINKMTILKPRDVFLEVKDSLHVFIITKKAYDKNTNK